MRVFGQDGTDEPRNLLCQQRQPRAAFVLAGTEAGVIGGQRVLQAGALQRGIQNLVAQIVLCAEVHELDGHLRQARDVFYQVFQRLAQLDRKQPSQAQTMDARSFRRIVEDFHIAVVAGIDERRIAEQRLVALADFQQFRQLAEVPRRQARVQRGVGRRFRFAALTCLSWLGAVVLGTGHGSILCRDRLERLLRAAAEFRPQLGQIAPHV